MEANRNGKAVFCSYECAVKQNNAEKAAQKQARSEAVKELRPPCEECGSTIPWEKRVGTRFCSKVCQHKAAWRLLAPGCMRERAAAEYLERHRELAAA